MSWTRRGLLVGLGAAAVWGYENHGDAIQNTDSSILQNKETPGKGTTVEHSGFEITPTDFALRDEITLVINDQSKDDIQVTAPKNTVLALAKIELKNTDIEKREGPALVPRKYKRFDPDDENLIDDTKNQIRLYGNGEGGVINKNKIDFGYDAILTNDGSLPAYKVGYMTNGPTVKPGELYEGWTFARVGKGTPYELHIMWGGKRFEWTLRTE